MKYLFISGTDFANRKLTGAHKRFIELVNSFADRNEVTLVGYPYKEFENKDISFLPILHRIGQKLPNHISEFLTLKKALSEYKKNIKYDVAIAFGPTAAIAYKQTGFKNVVSLFREDLIGYQKAVNASKIKIVYSWFLEKFAVDASSIIIVQCKNDKDSLISRHKGIEDKVFVQGNNINVSWIKKYKKVDGIGGSHPIVLFVGNFSSPRKGHQILLPAIGRLLDEGIGLELFVLGDGKEFEKYKTIYSKYSQIHFEGHTENVGHYITLSDIEIVPSLIDSCPNTVLEGLYAGIAVYGSNTGGIPELLVDDKYMFDANAESIYLFLKGKISNKEYLNDIENQKSLVDTLSFNWPERIERTIQVMKK